ncbi:Craniofacial development protein 2 [Bienertia sinuspersici]
MHKEDRKGAVVRWNEVHPMLECMNHCELEDMRATGRFFTWSNKQEGDKRVLSKIDKAMCNKSWWSAFPTAETLFLPENSFDHTPLMIKVYPTQLGKRPFRFFNYWYNHQDFIPTVQQVWQTEVPGCYMYQIMHKLRVLKYKLKNMQKDDVHTTFLTTKEWLTKA